LLQRDLIAVLASLRLRIQELWRRNGEGDLSVPGFWPQALAPLFWPLLLALALAIAVALPVALIQAAPAVLSEPESGPVSGLVSQRPSTASAAGQSAGFAGPPGAAPGDSAPSQMDGVEALAPAVADQPAEPPQPLLQLDPLVALLANDDPDHLIRSVHPDPAQARLDLELQPDFVTLPESRQRQLAQQWLERSEALGYEQLQLLGGGGELLGRRARVGSGMILFTANPEF
jgi:hypothetical protein